MKQRTDSQGVPYSYLVDNIKVLLIFLVVFNHIIAFQLVKVDVIVRYVWYAITIFHMPAFVFMSGYLSKKPQDVLKNVKNLLIPYILGYSLTWYAYIWTGRSMDYELLRPSGTVMWYVLALFIYRLTIEALGKVRFIVPLSIIFALWAGTRPEFTTYLSSSRIVVFFPFFVAGYLWKSDYTKVVRKFKGKWVLVLVSGLLLYAIPNFMIANEIPIDIFRGNHTYQLSGMDDITGMLIRLLMYLVSFVLVLTFLALIPDMKLPIQYALYYPERRFLAGDRLDFAALTQITFEKPDMDTFLGLPMAMQASRRGGSMPTVFNAANERAVALFLAKKIRFLEIYDVIAGAMEAHKTIADPTLEQILAAEQETYEWIANRYKMGE